MTTASQTSSEPDELEALVALALGEHYAGRLAEAAAAYRKILALRPDIAEVHNNLGNVLWQQGDLVQALARFEQAILLRPDYIEALTNLGIIHAQQGNLDHAQARFEQVLSLKPDCAEAHNNLGKVLLSQGKLDEAAARYEQALAFRPEYAEAHANLGNILGAQGKLDEAAGRFERAIALRPDDADSHKNLGNVFLSQGKLDEAMASYERALALWPNLVEAHNNLGNVLMIQGNLGKAAAHYQKALDLRPDFADAQLGRAICYLTEGDFERGWPAYEGRLRIPGFVPQPNIPRWKGEPLAGRSLLLLAEQGMGDTLHFVRYARLLKERGARVVLACQPALGRLLASQPDVDELFIQGSGELPRCDFYLPLMSAPGAFGTTAATIPRDVPYLAADPALTERWRKQLSGIDGFKIGIVWQGTRDYRFDRWRSIPLAAFAPLARLSGVRLISLQKGFGSEQVAQVDFPVLDLSGQLDEVAGPFMDTAAVIRNLDLVVAPDTVIAHLAGALGVPVWIALQFSSDWRWLQGRDDSPWYPTMRLFRQTEFDRWADVFERIAETIPARHSEAEMETFLL
jgi:Tfp pilus assembly protein PilF